MKDKLDLGNKIVIALTVAFFLLALFLKGITHDLLIEAGVLLVSIKLILMNYKTSISNEETVKKLNELKSMLNELNKKSDGRS